MVACKLDSKLGREILAEFIGTFILVVRTIYF
jgi:glycerol uptake facilitator-like aquaporin